MKLYHGTSETRLHAILRDGIVPRGERDDEGQWENAPSRPDCVYLTQLYAPYFALAACENGERWAILEIDTDELDEEQFLPDEDWLEQQLRAEGHDAGLGHPEGASMKERTAICRENLEFFQEYWRDSLKGLGNCSYQDAIPVEAIKRIALVDSKEAWFLDQATDPCISLMNCAVMRQKYENIIDWVFGGKLDACRVVAGLFGLDLPAEEVRKMAAHFHDVEQLTKLQQHLDARPGIEVLTGAEFLSGKG